MVILYSYRHSAFNLELGLPRTGLEKFETLVGVPNFSGAYSANDHLANQASHFQDHFASQISLRRLAMEFHNVLTNGERTPSLSLPYSLCLASLQAGLHREQCSLMTADLTQTAPGSVASLFSPIMTGESSTSSMSATVRYLALQLDQWRGMLPSSLQWQETQPAEFPHDSSSGYHRQPMYPPESLPMSDINPPSDFMFTTDLDSVPVAYPHALDIHVALLRTRYHYSKYLIYRPFIYKALHYPDQMTQEDAECAAECLKSCLKWPITMSPTCTHKRLIPCIFLWTQNLMGVLVLLHISRKAPILQRIRANLCGSRFEVEASETILLYMEWIRDLGSVDRAAEWAWLMLQELYRGED